MDSLFPNQKSQVNSGFTLLELMVTITVASVLAAMAFPSFKTTIQNNRLTTSANELVTALNIARSEAVKRGKFITVRKVDANSKTQISSTANWEDGWDVFIDENGNGEFDDTGAPPLDTFLRNFAGLNTAYTLRGDGGTTGFGNYIQYTPDGRSHSAGIFVICDNSDANDTAEANTSRLIMVSATGRVQMGLDTDADGIPNIDAATNSTDCTP